MTNTPTAADREQAEKLLPKIDPDKPWDGRRAEIRDMGAIDYRNRHFDNVAQALADARAVNTAQAATIAKLVGHVGALLDECVSVTASLGRCGPREPDAYDRAQTYHATFAKAVKP